MNRQEFLGARTSFDSRGRAVINATNYPAQHQHETLLMPLSHYTCLSVTGPDTHKFLQGQLTCDLQKLTPEQALAGALCTPKGRMVSNFYVQQQTADQVLLVLPHGTAAATLATLAKYIVFSKAEMQVEQSWCQIGLAGPQAETIVDNLFGGAATERLGATTADNGTAVCIAPQQQRYLVTLTTADLAHQWQKLSEAVRPVNGNVWDYLDIRAGFGFVQEQSVEMFIPQMLNLQLTEGISFTKGCYTGQEIIARTHYRGNLKRRMYRAACALDSAPEAGTPIFNDLKEQPIGNVVMAEQTTADDIELLAVMALSDAMNETLLLGDKQGPALQLLDLPYTFTD